MTMEIKKIKAKNSLSPKKPLPKILIGLGLNFPQIQLPCTKRNLLRYMASPGTTKSWRTTTTRCNATEQHQWRRLDPLNDSSKNSLVTSYPHNSYLGDDSCIPVVLSKGPNASYWCNLKVYTTTRIYPSSTLSSKQSRVKPAIVHVQLLHNIPSSTLMVDYGYYSYGYCDKYVSIRHECTTVDSFDAMKKYMELTSIVPFEGKFYALSLQGTHAVMQDVESRLSITDISTSRAVSSVRSRFFKEYLFELNGDILLVFLIYQKSVGVVDQVEVFRLCFSKLKWIKVERLQGKTLFLNIQCCVWGNSAEIGCRGNCVYFTQGSDNGWWIYDMENCCISPASSEHKINVG